MAGYIAKGSYMLDGEEKNFTGRFDIAGNIVSGYMSDPETPYLACKAEGNAGHAWERGMLSLARRSLWPAMPEMFFSLEKVDGKDGIDGEYEGFWSLTDHGAVAFKPRCWPFARKSSMIIPTHEKENTARISLEEIGAAQQE